MKTWKNLGFWHPSIAAKLINQETLEYAVPNAAPLDQRAAKTFSVVEDRRDDDHFPDLKLNLHSTLTYLATTGEILFHTAYWRSDGTGVLSLLDVLFEVDARLTLPDRLAPTVAASMPAVVTEAIEGLAQDCVEAFSQAAGAIGIPYKVEDTTMPGGTGSSRVALSVSQTSFVVIRCKA